MICESDIQEVSSVIVLKATQDGPQVLLVRRKRAPGIGEWDVPGGHLKKGEDKLHAAIREVNEETGLECDPEFICNGSPIEGRCHKQYLYGCVVPDDAKIKIGSDASQYRWFNLSKMPTIAFSQNSIVTKIAKDILGESIIRPRILNESADKGVLIVFEGVDGAGKSTQTSNLCKKLKNESISFINTCWNSSKPIHPAIKKLKNKKEMYPILFTLMHSADLWYRYLTEIEPALQEGKVVVCDRYYYTSHARDELRGVSRKLISDIYKGIRKPNIIFHCYAPVKTVMRRVTNRKEHSYYGNGEDLKLSRSPNKNLELYTDKLDAKYCELLPKEKGYVKLDMSGDIDDISEMVWEHVKNKVI
jgi:dTMP kinase